MKNKKYVILGGAAWELSAKRIKYIGLNPIKKVVHFPKVGMLIVDKKNKTSWTSYPSQLN